MTKLSEDDIVNRAYEIWERKGRPEDRATEFLTLAHEELRSEVEDNTLQTLDTF
jgi:hypothetical protein